VPEGREAKPVLTAEPFETLEFAARAIAEPFEWTANTVVAETPERASPGVKVTEKPPAAFELFEGAVEAK
jgi:hypothetical protein